MKRNKIWFVIAILVISALLLVACENVPAPTPSEHTHTYGAWTLTTEPTATTDGSATRKCACGEDETVTVANLTNTDVWTVKVSQDATHVSNGYAVYTSTYGTVTTTSTTGQHVYGNWTITKEPTEEATGSAIKVCDCGYSVVEEVPVLSNNVWTKDDSNRPSHDAAGSVVYTSDYGTVTVVVPAGAHSFGKWTNNNDGTHTRSCDCGKNEAADHVFDQRVANNNTKKADATCTTGAEYRYSCVCGAVGTETFFSGEGTGHAFSQFVLTKEPTCTETGLASVKCTKCDYEDDNSVIAALGHKWDNVYHPYFGTSQYWDTDTGEVIVEEDAKSTQHAHACTVCGVFDEANKVEHAYGDDYLVAEKDNQYTQMSTKHACVCGYTEVVNDKLGYLEYWTEGTKVPATYNDAGSVVYTKDNYTYTLTLPKLVAPYDNKTYYFVEADLSDEKTIGEARIYSRTSHVTLDANGEGEGVGGFPVNGANKVTMVDPTTGKITWTIGDATYNGYVDMSTGIVVISNENPFTGKVFIGSWLEDGALKAGAFNGSVWGDNMAVSYKHNCSIGEHEFNIYINEDGVVTFDVDFVDANGEAIAAGDIHSANYVKIAKGDAKLVAFAKNSEDALVETDGYEGSYTADLGSGNETIVLDGCGTFTAGTKSGTYTLVEGKTYTADMYQVVDNKNVAYYQITITNGTLTAVKPMVTITYETAHGTVADSYKSANTNVEFTLPTWVSITESDGKEYVFAGWKLDDATEDDDYIKTYIPTEAVKFVATWTQGTKAVTIIDAQGENETIRIGTGFAILSANGFPVYASDAIKNGYIFKGWYIDENANGVIEDSEAGVDSTTTVTADITVIAKWEKLPAYVGSYTLYDLGFENSKYNGKKSFAIDYDGNITGNISGTVTSYDETTGKLVWSDGVMYVDATTKFVVAPYSTITSSTIDIKEVYAGVIGVTSNTDYYNYGIKNASDNYCARFFKYNDSIAFWYNNAIYSNITITDALGNALSIIKSDSNSIANSATLVVKQGDTVIFSAAAVNGKFSSGSKTKDLDTYYGTYTLTDADSITFDGAGNFVWGDKNGTYTLTDADTATFDAYVVASGKNTEYHVVTLDVTNKTYTSTKPMVSVSYVSSVTPNETLTTPASVNKNIEITLPTLTNDAKAFAGWYLQTDDTQSIVDSKQTITDDVTYVAKWVERSPFEGTYTMLNFSNDTTGVSDIYNSDTTKLVINALGKGIVNGSNGFSSGSAVSISFVEGSTSVVTITAGSSTYYGVYDATSGIILRASGSTGFTYSVYMMVPYNAGYVKSDFAASFSWKDSVCRKFISFTDRNAETTRTIFIESENNVEFGVTWSAKGKNFDDVTNLADVKANAVMFTVTAGETTYNYAKNSSNKFTTLTDELQGKYTNGEDHVVLSGAGAIYFNDGASGSYTVAEDGTITALTSTACYTITLTGNTFTKVDNKVTITYNYHDGEGVSQTQTATPYSGIKYTLIDCPVVEGYAFCGWYTSADFSGSAVTSITPTVGTTYTYYAKLVVPHAMMGSYYGANLDPSTSGIAKDDEALSNSTSTWYSYKISIDVTGNVTDGFQKGGHIEDYDPATGAFYLVKETSRYYGYFNAQTKALYVETSVKTQPYHDILFAVAENNGKTPQRAFANTWDEGCTQLIRAAYTDSTYSYLFIYNRIMYVVTSWSASDSNGTAITDFTAIYNTASSVSVVTASATFEFGKVNNNFVLPNGYQGTYTASTGDGIGSITLDGYGSATIGSSTTPVAYDLDSANSKITFVHNNRMYVLTLDKTTFKYTQAQDGYQGEYTLPDNSTITLDGYGTVTGTSKTYVVSGTTSKTITITDGETSTIYYINDGNTLAEKSIFAGWKFTQSSSSYVEFNEGSTISGKVQCGFSFYIMFTGEYDADTDVLTCTVTGEAGNAATIGSTFTFTVSNGQLTLASGTFGSSVDVSVGNIYTNDDFVLA